MPRRRKRNYKKRPSKRMYKKKYSVSIGKLMDSKINCKIEERCVEIARKEINKSIVYHNFQGSYHNFERNKIMYQINKIEILS